MLLRSILLASALFLLAAAPATAQNCSFTAQTSTFPTLTGRVTYADTTAGQLFIYDFQSASQVTVPSQVQQYGGSGRAIRNPVFSPDGKGVLFSGVTLNGASRDLYYWQIGTTTVTDLTTSISASPHEDGKFSSDAKKIVWKDNGNITTADFSNIGTPSLSNVTAITTNGVVGQPTEASGPVFSPSMQYIFYFTGNSSSTEHVQRYSYPGNNTGAAFTQDASLQYFYPAAPDIYDLLFVRQISATNTHLQINQYFRLNNSFATFNATDCAADNSDPGPIDERYFIYSRNSNTGLGGGQFELYLGRVADGAAWLLPSAVNTGGSASFVGANYTNAR
jgi:Tol biopolymer transport system component